MDDQTRNSLLVGLPLQRHHMATDKTGSWKTEYERIAGAYGLDLAGDWNYDAAKNTLRHSGSHPWNYHNWVYENMEIADETAFVAYPDPVDIELRKALFLELFDRWVSQVVRKDPSIVKVAYWKCRPFYRWR